MDTKLKQVIVEFEVFTELSEAVLETKIIDQIKFEIDGEKIVVRIYNK